MTNPHALATLTWRVTNSAGLVVWNISHTATPYTWWPNLYPDICKLAMGAPANWDVENYFDLQKPPSQPSPRGRLGLDPWGGCGDWSQRSMLRTLTFYVCPGFHRPRGWTHSCSGASHFYCRNWGCETTGDTYWKPTSGWDYITVTANYSHTRSSPKWTQNPACKNQWCHPLKIAFTESGKRQLNWVKGYTWGLRFYKERYDDGLTFTIKLSIETSRAAIGPNPVLALPPRRPRLTPPAYTHTLRDVGHTRTHGPMGPPGTPTGFRNHTNPPEATPTIPTPSPKRQPVEATGPEPKDTRSHLTQLVQYAFQVLNYTNPSATESCWLCYETSPPFYEGLATSGSYNSSSSPSVCRWSNSNHRLTMTAISGKGTCIGQVPPEHSHICNQTIAVNDTGEYLLPPQNAWWACASGLTPCLHLSALNRTNDYCVLVHLVPRLIYHPYEDMISYWEEGLHRVKREPVSLTLALILGLGLGTARVATGTSALISQQHHYQGLREAIDADIQELESSISKLQESVSSLSEVVLQNRRGLDLLFLQQGGLCAALKEQCCFYVDHSGVVKDSMAKVREGLAKRKKEREAAQGLFQSWFNSSPWLTTLISSLLGPICILLLLLTFGPCILNRLVTFFNQRLQTVQIMLLRQQYQPLDSRDNDCTHDDGGSKIDSSGT